VILTFLRTSPTPMAAAAAATAGDEADLAFGNSVVEAVASALGQPVSRFKLLSVTGTPVAMSNGKVAALRWRLAAAETMLVSFMILPATESTGATTVTAEELSGTLDTLVRTADPVLSAQPAMAGLVPSAGAQPTVLHSCSDGSFAAECPPGEAEEGEENWFLQWPLYISIPVLAGIALVLVLVITCACLYRRRYKARADIARLHGSVVAPVDAFQGVGVEGAPDHRRGGGTAGSNMASTGEMELTHNPSLAMDQRLQQHHRQQTGAGVPPNEFTNLQAEVVGAPPSDAARLEY
jgi:hypothetical protein